MATIINFNAPIDARQLRTNTRQLSPSLLSPAREDAPILLAREQTSDPIKSLEDIERISRFLLQSRRFRDNMLFVVGINFGLRISDLKTLRFSNLIGEDLVFKECFPVFEKKTRNTRKRKKNRYITVNEAVVEAVTLYLENTPGVCLSDYMFRSESNNGCQKNEPMSTNGINDVLKGIAKSLNLSMNFTSHSLRKTFCYWMMVQGNNDPRRLLLLQKMLGHSSTAQTLAYIGITDYEIQEAYKNLNIGLGCKRYIIGTSIFEQEEQVV